MASRSDQPLISPPRPRYLAGVWRDKWLILASLYELWHARLTLSLMGFGPPAIACSKTMALPFPPDDLLHRVGWSIHCASFLVIKPTCLVRAMAGQHVLARKGYGSEIRVGVRGNADRGFEAHAWLVSGETIILGGTPPVLQSYAPMIGARP
jgi:hypothetical protein